MGNTIVDRKMIHKTSVIDAKAKISKNVKLDLFVIFEHLH